MQMKLAEEHPEVGLWSADVLPCLPGERCQGGEVLEVECHLQNKAITAEHDKCVCKEGFGFLDWYVGFLFGYWL